MKPHPLPADFDDDPQPVAWSRVCPVVTAELRAIWWRLTKLGLRLPRDEVVIGGGR